MRYKDDWELAKKRHEAFWQREIVDRCCINVKAFDRAAFLKTHPLPRTDEERVALWTDPETIIKRSRARMEYTFYGGEAFPCIFVNLGAGGHAGFFKGEKHFFGDSVWFFPTLESPDEVEFDPDSFLYRKTLELARAYVKDSRGDYFVSMPDTTGNADALAHLMGSENLLVEMMEDPEAVEAALNKIEPVYEKIMREIYAIVKDVNEGGSSVDWMGTWAPGFHAQMQCDLSVMISNPMFKRFIVPELQAQTQMLDYAIYHLDGMEQARHLDDLLALPRLRAIQWTQVDGQPPCTAFLPELRRIQAAGKGLLIIVDPEQIEEIMANLSSKGLFLTTAVETREQAEQLIKNVAKWTHD